MNIYLFGKTPDSFSYCLKFLYKFQKVLIKYLGFESCQVHFTINFIEGPFQCYYLSTTRK